jgi:hypothetical protein
MAGPESIKEQRTQAPTSEGGESEGLTMAAPAFSLTASPIQRITGPGTDGSPDSLIDPWRADLENGVTAPTVDWNGRALPADHDDGISVTEVGRNRSSTQYNANYTLENETFTLETYLFQGESDQKAMIVGGIHGSERGSVEIARSLIARLQTPGHPRPFYSLLIVPQLMAHNTRRTGRVRPDGLRAGSHDDRYSNIHRNADGHIVRAGNPERRLPESFAGREPLETNSREYTDPNRQAPRLGHGVDAHDPRDARRRPIEPENYIMVSLFNRYHPSRIVMLHGIDARTQGGIYADPRTTADGTALGYDPDHQLAVEMARSADTNYTDNGGTQRNGPVPHNAIRTDHPDTRYHTDPAPVAAGEHQRRLTRAGTSFGGWFATEVNDPTHTDQNRPAVTTLTLETPTYGDSTDMGSAEANLDRRRELDALTTSLESVFLARPSAGSPP